LQLGLVAAYASYHNDNVVIGVKGKPIERLGRKASGLKVCEYLW